MVVRNSPSHASNIESSIHLAGKMQHSGTIQNSNVNLGQKTPEMKSPEMKTLANRNSGILSATQDGPSIEASPRTRMM